MNINKTTTIKYGDLFDQISKKEGHIFKIGEEYIPKTQLKIKSPDNTFKNITAMIKKLDTIFEIEISDGHKFKAGSSHFLKTDKGIVQVDKLTTEDFQILVNYVPFDIISITKFGEEEVFDVTIESDDHLYKDAHGIVHHNTYNITKTIKDGGYKQIEPIEIPEGSSAEELLDAGIDIEGESEGDWVHIKGASTAFGMYMNLFRYKNKLIVFDDCDSVFTDKDGINILKGALDSSDKRVISWISKATTGKKALAPPRFNFKGRIIFISNWPSKKIDSAIRNRSFVVDINLKQQDVLKRIQTILPHIGNDSEIPLTMEAKGRAFEFLKEAAEDENNQMEISIRTLVNFAKIAASGVPQWKRLMKIQSLNI